MSTTLDRLKALNTKLEEKLSEKEAVSANEAASKKSQETEGKKEAVAPRETKTDTNALARKIISHMGIDEKKEPIRSANIYRVAKLFVELNIEEKIEDFNNIFIYKAMNISGIGLKEEDFGEVRKGKYTQIIAITYEPDETGKKKAKNISLSYFGKAEKLEQALKNDIIEFVLRWRYEKAFQNLEHYHDLLERIKPADSLF